MGKNSHQFGGIIREAASLDESQFQLTQYGEE